MIDKFWESLGGDLAEEWLKRAFSPPFLFWAAGLTFYVRTHDWRSRWQEILALDPVSQIGLLGLVVLALVLSSLLSAGWRFTLLRWMEGYFPLPLRWLEAPLVRRQAQKLQRAEMQLNDLLSRAQTATPQSERRRGELELFVHYYPASATAVRATRLGNIMRSGETAPRQKYGLDAPVCWPRLWHLLPEPLRADLTAVHQRLLLLAELWGMGLLSLLWGIWDWRALLLGLFWAFIAYRMALPVAMSYADLIETAFDLYRLELYRALGWKPPDAGEGEIAAGEALTEFLWRGTGAAG